MVLEVTDISSSSSVGELATTPPKQGDDVPSSTTATSTLPFPSIVESRDDPSEVGTATSMRMYAEELTAVDNSNAEALLGFSPTNEHRDKPVCGAYFDASASSDGKRVSSTIVPSKTTEECQAPEPENIINKVTETAAVTADTAEIEEGVIEDLTTDVMKEETPVEEAVEEKTVDEGTIVVDFVEEKAVEEVSVQKEEGEKTDAPVEEGAHEAAIQVTELIPEQVFLESSPDSIEASSSKSVQLDIVTEHNQVEPETAEVGTSLARKSKGKKKRINFLPKHILSRISLASSVTIPSVVRSFTANTLSSLSKPSVPKASMRKMAKLPKMEKLPSVSKLSSTVVASSSRRLSALHQVSQRSLSNLPKKLSKSNIGKKSKKSERTTSPKEIEDTMETATPKTNINSTWLETDLENTTSSEAKIVDLENTTSSKAKIVEVEPPAEVKEVTDSAPEAPASASFVEKPKQRNYFEVLLDTFDSLCAPICKNNIIQAESLHSPKSTSEHTDDNPQVITTNATDNSILDGVKSLCSIATEYSFFREEEPVVQETEPDQLNQAIVVAKEEPDKLETAALMAKKALDTDTGAAKDNKVETKGVKSMFSFRRSVLQKDKSLKPSLKIFAPSVSSVKAASDMKKVAGQSLRRLTSRKHNRQVPCNEAEEPSVQDINVPPESQSLDEIQTIFVTTSCVDEKAAALNKNAAKEGNNPAPADEFDPNDKALLRMRQSTKTSEEEEPTQPKAKVFANAETLLGRSRSSISEICS